MSLYFLLANKLPDPISAKEKIQAVEIMKKLRYYSSWLNKKGGKE
jgi:hypothetical protein